MHGGNLALLDYETTYALQHTGYLMRLCRAEARAAKLLMEGKHLQNTDLLRIAFAAEPLEINEAEVCSALKAIELSCCDRAIRTCFIRCSTLLQTSSDLCSRA